VKLLKVLSLILLGAVPASAQQYVPGSSNMTTTQVTVGATATLIVAAQPGRSNLFVVNQGAITVCFGNSASVTLLNGICLPSGSTAFAGIVLPYAGALYGIAASNDIVSVAALF
jgi:hypothetical protein